MIVRINENTYKSILMEGNEAYKTSIVGLFYNGKIIILKRGSTAPWMPNKWSLVGGGVDENETPLAAAYRECEEEIGLKPKNVKFINKIQTDSEGVLYYFIGELDSNNVVLDYENSDYAFISKDEMANYDFVPYVTDFIKIIL